ncbi:hypothetical protein KXX44_003473 [Aspergillus fumigatus]|nr:hypothetical protein KXX44_003473 [Aspergillus fumigatus]KAH1843022.1 hypothetical protein KXX55_003520 [Aspergillus fumigatus]KAH2443915.1 hypothetical protein KXV83_002534 [Aspergillus fumigatus]KAH2980266.1 hypothetical protein KXW58_002894 [Aspergillus fumigatus]KAH3037556.1 hypothetical protein KXW01_004241 [Aspergillus fumigatus]
MESSSLYQLAKLHHGDFYVSLIALYVTISQSIDFNRAIVRAVSGAVPTNQTLRRVGPDRRKNWVLYETANEDDFLSWWLQTEYGRQLNGSGRSKIRWSVEHSAEVWKHFDQVAELSSGRPKVICRACSTLLDHPQHKSHGTSVMGKHQRSSACRKGKKRASSQVLISDAIQRAYASPPSDAGKFTKAQLEEQLLKTITCLRLPFKIVEDPTFQDLLNLIHSGPRELEIPSAKTLRRRLQSSRQETLEEDEALSNQEDFDPISDDEEDAPERTDGHSFPSEQTYRAVIEVAGAIPGNGNEQNMSEEETDEMPRLPPPVTQLGGRAQRRSGRATMLSSRLQGYELY